MYGYRKLTRPDSAAYSFLFAAVELSDEENQREGKQILVRSPEFDSFWDGLLEANPKGLVQPGSCFTSKGLEGKCMSFRRCYPYNKVTEVGNWENWILGTYDTCTYYNVQGRQVC